MVPDRRGSGREKSDTVGAPRAGILLDVTHRRMRSIAAVVAAIGLWCAACTATTATDRATPPGSGTNTSVDRSPAVAGSTTDSDSGSPLNAGQSTAPTTMPTTGQTTGPTTGATSSGTQATTSSTSSDPPGASRNPAVSARLAAAGLLDGDGQVDLHAAANSSSAQRAEISDICEFLFGEPEDISRVTRLKGQASLDPMSAFWAEASDPAAPAAESSTESESAPDTAASTTLACVYALDGVPVLVLQVGDGPPVDPDLPGDPTIVSARGLQAVLSYSPDHVGPRINAAQGRLWLNSALARLTPTTTGAG